MNGLTKREVEVIELLLQGLSNKEIGNKLFVSESTIKTHLWNVFKKRGVKKRAELVFQVMKERVSAA